METQDHVELLRFLRRRMLQRGLGELADRITDDLEDETADAHSDVIRFLHALETEIRLQAALPIREITDRLQGVVEGQIGDQVHVALSEDDQRRFGASVVSIEPQAGYDSLVSDLRELRAEIERGQDSG